VLDQATEYAEQAVAAAETDPPAAARAATQLGNLAMFLERSEAALERFRTAAVLYRRAGEHVRAFADDVSVAQAMIYADRSAEARDMLVELLAEAHRAGNPSLLAWAYYITVKPPPTSTSTARSRRTATRPTASSSSCSRRAHR
jgi:hypothetical protein